MTLADHFKRKCEKLGLNVDPYIAPLVWVLYTKLTVRVKNSSEGNPYPWVKITEKDVSFLQVFLDLYRSPNGITWEIKQQTLEPKQKDKEISEYHKELLDFANFLAGF